MTDKLDIDWDKVDDLVPAIVQNYLTGQVLMLGYMNAEALEATLKTKQVTFYSRTKHRLWTKGETSGNTIALVNITSDCDNDTLLVQAIPAGPTCHTGEVSCFNNKPFLSELGETIEARKDSDPSDSYTAELLAGPTSKAAQKVGEEGVEVALAAVGQSNEELVMESADLVYHLLVLLAKRNVSAQEVVAELQRRAAD